MFCEDYAIKIPVGKRKIFWEKKSCASLQLHGISSSKWYQVQIPVGTCYHINGSTIFNYLSFFALKRGFFLSFFYSFLCSENSTVSQGKMKFTPISPTLVYFRQEGRVKFYIHEWLPIAVQLPLNEDYRNLEKSLLFGCHHMYLKLQ